MRPAWERSRHLWGIDFVRFAAALLVAGFHLTWRDPPIPAVAWYGYGWIGVQIFFVISGLVIARSANNTTPSKFVESRVLRLYPAAWICAAVGLAVAALVHHHQPDLAQRFAASFLLSPVGPFLASAYWTLPIEIVFYALIFVVLMAGMFDRLERIAAWLCIASAAYNVAYAMQCAGVIEGPDLDFGYDWKNITLLRHGIYFATGIFIWLWSERRLSRVGWAALALAVAAAPLEITCRTAELIATMTGHLAWSAAWLIPIAVWLAAVIAIVWSAGWEGRLGRPSATFLAVARSAGLATYPLYLLHEQFGEAARNALLKSGLPFLPSVGAAVLATTLLALLVARVAEPSLRSAMRGWLGALWSAAGDVPWLQRLFRSGGTL
jgi:peptidoglycan/LPS O-acetylase OafA/YrhL